MNKQSIELYLILTSVICSCNHLNNKDGTLTAQEKTSISSEVSQTLHNYYLAVKKDGLRAEFSYLDSTSDFFWVAPGYNSAISYDSVASILKKNQSANRSVNNVWENLEIKPLTKRLAAYWGRIHSIIIDTDGKETEARLIEAGLLIKIGEDWKLLCGQTNLISQ